MKPLPTPSQGRESHNPSLFLFLPNTSGVVTNNGGEADKSLAYPQIFVKKLSFNRHPKLQQVAIIVKNAELAHAVIKIFNGVANHRPVFQFAP